jgi:hypothetical protein
LTGPAPPGAVAPGVDGLPEGGGLAAALVWGAATAADAPPDAAAPAVLAG